MENDEAGCQPLDAPLLCANNCGFFGSATTLNLCSRCYREVIQKQAKETEAAAAISAVHAQLQNNHGVGAKNDSILTSDMMQDIAEASTGAAAIASSSEMAATSSQQQPPKPNRCGSCKKRVGLAGFKCRCGGLFCASHRYSDKHDCVFDYKAAAKEAITKANPIIKADKIDKI